MESVALLSRYAITIASKKLVLQCTLKEPIPVKSGAWDDNGAFMYTSSTDIKYWRPHGDSKIIQTMDIPIYITKVSGDTIFCLDQDGKNTAITINTSRVSKKRKAESDGDTTMRTIDDSAKNDSQPFPGEADNSRAKRRKIDDKFSETPTEISWDMENAPVPSGFPPEKVYPNILRSLREAKIMGPVKITGYVGYLNSHVPAGLDPRIEIKLAHLYNRPVNSKDDQAADKKLIEDIEIWLEKKEKARNIMFITGDNGFSSVVEDLKKSGHNILLAYVQGLEKNTSAEIRKLADFFWEW
ncbi:PREDICTED: uncharacterized protein LOC104775140, partial [Camelina sativa]|uniref:Uncharacterized protein LOC104775140 n=1 Tax=Camelina sativa TaxID=90675 RepID=A0ABM0Y9P9_CAMSA